MKLCEICGNIITGKRLYNAFSKTCSPVCNRELNRKRALARYHKTKVLKGSPEAAQGNKKEEGLKTAHLQSFLCGRSGGR